MKRASLSNLLVLGIILVSCFALLPAQQWGRHGQFGGHSLFPFFGPSHSTRHIGLFPVGPSFRSNFFFGGFRTAPMFDRHNGLAWGNRFWARYPTAYYRPELMYTSKKFVEEWADREPPLLRPASNIERSLILNRGMSEEEVVRALGSPLQKIQLDDREVWKYSSYSLLFQSGALIEIR